ncbi:MAG: hypothetical protein LW629_09975 [Burkholderiales bacterium]|jgi:hypothetical protein|nr:hypothetical protein [Burkholderiales bacterium]
MRPTPYLQTLFVSALLFAGSVQAHQPPGAHQSLPAGLLENKAIELPRQGGEITLRLDKGKPETGVNVVRVKKAGNVVIKVQSNSTEELHLHGYDLRLPVSGSAVSEFRFQALKTGRFEMESHTTHKPVLILEVHP